MSGNDPTADVTTGATGFGAGLDPRVRQLLVSIRSAAEAVTTARANGGTIPSEGPANSSLSTPDPSAETQTALMKTDYEGDFPSGIWDAYVDTLEVIEFRYLPEFGQCDICLKFWLEDPTEPITKYHSDPDHVFHRECLLIWLQDQGACPLCRTKIGPPKYSLNWNILLALRAIEANIGVEERLFGAEPRPMIDRDRSLEEVGGVGYSREEKSSDCGVDAWGVVENDFISEVLGAKDVDEAGADVWRISRDVESFEL